MYFIFIAFVSFSLCLSHCFFVFFSIREILCIFFFFFLECSCILFFVLMMMLFCSHDAVCYFLCIFQYSLCFFLTVEGDALLCRRNLPFKSDQQYIC